MTKGLHQNHKILVVDNEPLVVEELVEFLVARGFQCVGSIGPKDALECFRNMPEIDIVLSDFQMPGMTGVELVENLRAIAPVGRIFEVIIFTGNAERDDVIDALRAGVADYYQKPLDLDQLLEGLSRVMTKLEKRSAESRIKMLSHNLQVLSSSLSEICNGIGIGLPYGSEGLGPLPQALAPAAPYTPAAAPDAETFLMPDVGPSGNKLSPRQKDVAALIAQGFTNYQIACELGISENTVKIYVSQVLRIFNISNRTQLALALARSGRDELLQGKPDSDSETKKRRAGT